MHDKPPRDWEPRIAAALARSGIRPLTLDPVPDGAVEWSVGAVYRPISRRRIELVRFEIGYARDATRAHPWWVNTVVRHAWANTHPEGTARDRWIADSLPGDAQDWLAMWSVEITDATDASHPEHRREVHARREQRLDLRETTIRIDGTAYAARELRLPDHRAIVADVPALGIAAQVFLRRDDRDPIALRSITIEHPA